MYKLLIPFHLLVYDLYSTQLLRKPIYLFRCEKTPQTIKVLATSLCTKVIVLCIFSTYGPAAVVD